MAVAAGAPSMAVVQFPGTNCERETARALSACVEAPVDVIWHAEAFPLDRYAAVVLNKVDFAKNKYYYSRYYGHQYKNYYAEAAL